VLGENVSSFFKKKFGKEEDEFSVLESAFIPRESTKLSVSET
jgi:hypothetical protein